MEMEKDFYTWPMMLDLTKDECKQALRSMEISAYASMVSVLRAQGELTREKRKLLSELQSLFNISVERHRAEIRRAINDEVLNTIAETLAGPNSSVEWSVEGRRLVPLMPRLVPRAGYAAIATRMAEKYAKGLSEKPLPPPIDTASYDTLYDLGAGIDSTDSEEETDGLRFLDSSELTPALWARRRQHKLKRKMDNKNKKRSLKSEDSEEGEDDEAEADDDVKEVESETFSASSSPAALTLPSPARKRRRSFSISAPLPSILTSTLTTASHFPLQSSALHPITSTSSVSVSTASSTATAPISSVSSSSLPYLKPLPVVTSPSILSSSSISSTNLAIKQASGVGAVGTSALKITVAGSASKAAAGAAPTVRPLTPLVSLPAAAPMGTATQQKVIIVSTSSTGGTPNVGRPLNVPTLRAASQALSQSLSQNLSQTLSQNLTHNLSGTPVAGRAAASGVVVTKGLPTTLSVTRPRYTTSQGLCTTSVTSTGGIALMKAQTAATHAEIRTPMRQRSNSLVMHASTEDSSMTHSSIPSGNLQLLPGSTLTTKTIQTKTDSASPVGMSAPNILRGSNNASANSGGSVAGLYVVSTTAGNITVVTRSVASATVCSPRVVSTLPRGMPPCLGPKNNVIVVHKAPLAAGPSSGPAIRPTMLPVTPTAAPISGGSVGKPVAIQGIRTINITNSASGNSGGGNGGSGVASKKGNLIILGLDEESKDREELEERARERDVRGKWRQKDISVASVGPPAGIERERENLDKEFALSRPGKEERCGSEKSSLPSDEAATKGKRGKLSEGGEAGASVSGEAKSKNEDSKDEGELQNLVVRAVEVLQKGDSESARHLLRRAGLQLIADPSYSNDEASFSISKLCPEGADSPTPSVVLGSAGEAANAFLRQTANQFGSDEEEEDEEVSNEDEDDDDDLEDSNSSGDDSFSDSERRDDDDSSQKTDDDDGKNRQEDRAMPSSK